MTENGRVEDFEPQPFKIYGKWFVKTTKEDIKRSLDERGKFPPKNSEHIYMFPGDGTETYDDIPSKTIAQMKEIGATHFMIARGETCTVYTIDGEVIGMESESNE